MTNDEVVIVTKELLADRLGVDPKRLTVKLRSIGEDHHGEDSCQMTVLIDEKEPEGEHREILLRWMQSLDGKLVGSA